MWGTLPTVIASRLNVPDVQTNHGSAFNGTCVIGVDLAWSPKNLTGIAVASVSASAMAGLSIDSAMRVLLAVAAAASDPSQCGRNAAVTTGNTENSGGDDSRRGRRCNRLGAVGRN